jgi:carbohydrate kinase (thermoresistant glucokinase family)
MTGPRLVVMGVAASGKSTVGEALAEALGAGFLDADDAHPQANIDKMAAGTPLTDEDRWPWLARLTRELADADEGLVITCSALKRRYRDQLRWAGDVRFIFLDPSRDEIERRINEREDHFMGPAMVESQFAALERPAADEHDVVHIDGAPTLEAIVGQALADLPKIIGRPGAMLSVGGPDYVIGDAELVTHIAWLAGAVVAGAASQRVLLVPPDHTRLYSGAGVITAQLFELLNADGHHVRVLPALGTHAAMDAEQRTLMFGTAIPDEAYLVHDWRAGLVDVGEISAGEVAAVSGGRFDQAIPVQVSEHLFDGYDAIVSIGQVVPHEVIGLANYTKNIIIGLGGAPTIHRSHQLGALCDMETIMGRVTTPVRQVIDTAFDRFLADRLRIFFALTVMEETAAGIQHRGLTVGNGGGASTAGAAFLDAAELAQAVNTTRVDEPWSRVSCWLDPDEFHSTWLGNKSVYRTRMAIADEGELIVLAPGVRRFGEDDHIDELIRRHGYRGTPATRAALVSDPELAASLSAAAHLIHGSSEGRFRIVYCTDPDAGGLTQSEVESVGFEWRSLPEELAHLGVDGTSLTGPRVDALGGRFEHIANPALGLWTTSPM